MKIAENILKTLKTRLQSAYIPINTGASSSFIYSNYSIYCINSINSIYSCNDGFI